MKSLKIFTYFESSSIKFCLFSRSFPQSFWALYNCCSSFWSSQLILNASKKCPPLFDFVLYVPVEHVVHQSQLQGNRHAHLQPFEKIHWNILFSIFWSTWRSLLTLSLSVSILSWAVLTVLTSCWSVATAAIAAGHLKEIFGLDHVPLPKFSHLWTSSFWFSSAASKLLSSDRSMLMDLSENPSSERTCKPENIPILSQ